MGLHISIIDFVCKGVIPLASYLNQYRVCNKCKKEFFVGNTRICPHPKINEKIGTIICGWCCKKCKHEQDGKCIYELSV